MSNSTLLDNPLLKVSRAVAACSRCRRAKTRCDGKLPACSACERVGKASSCSGASDEFAKGKERSYVASLENYCEKLENQVASLRHHQKSLPVEEPGKAQECSITSASGSLTQTHRKEVSDIDDLVGDFGFLSVNATSRDFHGVTSSTSFANLLMSVSLVQSLPPPSSPSLPPRYEATPLLQHYFDNFFIQLPFFFETSFWASVDSVYQSEGRFAKPFDHWIVHVVLAIAAASMSHRRWDRNYQRASSLVSDALQYAEDVLCPGSITGIQSILLLAQYSLVDPCHFRSWYLVGMAVRVMVDLGLHHDPPSEVVSDVDRLELRRRVFHSIYSLDRCVSSALGRTFSFSNDSINVALPRSPSSGSLGSSSNKQTHVFLRSIEPGLQIAKVREILSSGYQDMYYSGRDQDAQPLPRIWALCWKIREWHETSSSGAPPSLSALYRLEMLYTTITILSPSHRYPEPCDFNKVLLFDQCMSYVDQLHGALKSPHILPFITFTDMQRVYQIGRQLVELLTQDFDLLLSPSVPVAPPESPGKPPSLRSEDRIAWHARSIKCLTNIRDLLHYCWRKWDMGDLLDQFERISANIQERLARAPVAYFSRPGPYAADDTDTLLAARGAYLPFSTG